MGARDESQRPFKNIEKEAEKVLRKHGLIPVHWHWGMTDPLELNVMVRTDPDFEAPTGDDEFDAIIAGNEAAEQEQRQATRADKARKDLTDLRDTLKNQGDGLGFDD